MEIDSGIPFSSTYSQSGSVQLRGGKLYKSCDCIKRNGLQMDCRKTECFGRSCYMSATPSCSPGNSAQRFTSYVIGLGGQTDSYGNYNQYQNIGTSDLSGYSNAPGVNIRGLSAQYSMSEIGDGNYTRSAGSNVMNYNTNYGGPIDTGSQFMPAPQVAPYGECLPSGESVNPSQFASYGPGGMEMADMNMQQYDDYMQG